MQKILLLALIISLLLVPSVNGQGVQDGQKTQIVEAKKIDDRALILQNYLAKYNSPLQTHAQDFIDAADHYGIDWKLVPAIAGVESTFGKHIPGGFNGWGWGVYGNQAIFFNSWRHGIFTVSQGLKERYVAKGLDTPHKMNKIYAASPTWGTHVNYFIKDMERFVQDQAKENHIIFQGLNTSKTAGSSAELFFKEQII